MGLDATVYCNCIERGLLRTPHPYPDLLYICEDGCPEIRSSDPERQSEHDRWQSGAACNHEDMVACFAWLGNISGVGHIRNLLTSIATSPDAPNLRVLLDKVVYSGIHCGDYLTMEEVTSLGEEIQNLQQFNFKHAAISSRDEPFVRSFLTELQRLVETSLSMHKPISF